MNELSFMSNEELIKLYEENNCNFSEINRQFGLSKDFSRRFFIKRGIDYNKILENNLKIKKPQKLKFCKYCGKQLTEVQIRNHGEFCSHSCSASFNNRNRIRKKKPKFKIERNLEDRNKLISGKETKRQKNHNKLLTEKYSQFNIPLLPIRACFICGEIECDNPICKRFNFQSLIGLVKFGLDPTSIGTKRVFIEIEKVKKSLEDLYKTKSSLEIGKLFNSEEHTVLNILRRLEIPIRNLSESTKLAIEENRNKLKFRNKIIIHRSWDEHLWILRSSYEESYANYLDSIQTYYEVESLKIEYYDSNKNKMRFAIPDFYIPDTKEIFEIKSDFTLSVQNITDKFMEYRKLGYIPKLILEGEEIDLFKIKDLIQDEKRLDTIYNRFPSRK